MDWWVLGTAIKDVSDLSSTVKTGLRESSEEVGGQNSKFTSTAITKEKSEEQRIEFKENGFGVRYELMVLVDKHS